MSRAKDARRAAALALGLVIGLNLATVAARADALYAVRQDDDVLVRIDLPALTFTPIGNLGVNFQWGGLAYDPAQSTMYMVDGRSANGLYRVNLATGAATFVGTHGITDLFGLEFVPKDNALYGTSLAGGFYKLNTTTGAATLVGNYAATIPNIATYGLGGLAYDSRRDRLIGILDGPGDLYAINRATGAATFVADVWGNNNGGLAYDPARDLLWNVHVGTLMLSYDPANAYATTLRASGLPSYDGLAYVPEPATGVIALGAAGACLRRRRKS